MDSHCELDGVGDVLGVVDFGGSGEVVLLIGFQFEPISGHHIVEGDSDFVVTDGTFGGDGDGDLRVLEGNGLRSLDRHQSVRWVAHIPGAGLSRVVVVEEALQHSVHQFWR